MKFASILLFVATAAFTGTSALPVAAPQENAGTCPPPPSSTTTSPTSISAPSTPTVDPTLETSPPLPLSDYQQPINLDNTTTFISPSLVMVVDETRPDTPIPRVRQIGPNAYVSLPFTATHAGRMCRFRFALSNLADGGNGQGFEDIYRLKSGTVDTALTYNNQPVLEDAAVASFAMGGSIIAGTPRLELHLADRREDFVCPGEPLGLAIRGRDGASYNWSWNKGVIVEVLAEGGKWWDDGNGGRY